MEEVVKIILDAGGLVVLAGLFVFSWLQDRTKTNKTLEELSKSNKNIADALNILKMSYDLQKEELVKQNMKLDSIHEDVKEIKIREGILWKNN